MCTLTELHLLPNKMLSPVYLGRAGDVDLTFSGEVEAAQGCISAQTKIWCICRYFSVRALTEGLYLRVVFGVQLLLWGCCWMRKELVPLWFHTGRFCSRGCLRSGGRVKTRMVIALLLNLFLLMDFQLMTLIPMRIMELVH